MFPKHFLNSFKQEVIDVANLMGIDKATKVAEKIRVSLQETPLILEDGKPLTIRSSFGVSEITNSDDFSTAIKSADDRLYKAKEQGRNRVVAF